MKYRIYYEEDGKKNRKNFESLNKNKKEVLKEFEAKEKKIGLKAYMIKDEKKGKK